jgi:sterol desaturase/sphingolipid hydroxylase (fatty acid hydroxylase superfamily)
MSQIKTISKEYSFNPILYLLAVVFLLLKILVPTKILAPKYWPRKIEDEGLFSTIFMYITHESIFIFSNIFFYIIYHFEWKFFEKYKVEDEPWPWQEDKNKWKLQLTKTIKLILFNHLIVIPLLTLPSILKGKSPVRTDYESLPDLFEVSWQLMFIYFMDDFLFYWSHRLLHLSVLYSKIHKIHHEHKITVGIAAEYAHPIEFIFGNILPTNAGSLILGKRCHLLTSGIYLLFKIFSTTHSHSGYQLPFAPLEVFARIFSFFTKAEFHSYHHLKFTGNYAGGFFFWDHLFNTYNPKYLNVKEERKKVRKLM